ncbi:MAG: ABC transporter substrate-binding protein, partial [Actinomycetota bacterium]|nr:ABC transporter substrate-binding protein [Actinomycetota bacterium]
TYFSASSFGFIGAVYAAMGATNIADDADAEGFGFPQLTEEYIVEADPELIVITDQVTYTPDDVAARPGWQDIAAVQNNNIVVVEADTASRWGPRLPQFISTVAEALAAATPVG